MRSQLQLTPNQRGACALVAIAILIWGAGQGGVHFFAAVAGFYIILYAAGGGRVPWKISWRDYFLYVAISVSLVAAVIGYALIQVRRGR